MWATTQARGGGCYIEQILIRFTDRPGPGALEKAWQQTVADTAVLRVVITDRSARLSESTSHPWTNHDSTFPIDGFSDLLENDRRTPFPTNQTPSRCQYWPASGVMLWTVHHALLDGRSMTAILRRFLLHFTGIDPGPAPVWPGCLATDPAQSTAAREGLTAHAPAPREDEEPFRWNPGVAAADEIPWYVRRSIPIDLLDQLRKQASDLSTTLHGIVQWAWGWTLARIGGYDHSVLGVVRSAHWSLPQDQVSAAYLMATLPIPTRADGTLNLGESIRHYREAVLAIRDFPLADPREAAAALGRPASHLWDSVIMTENHSLEESVRPNLPPGLIDSITIHERTGEPLTASAWLGAQPAIEIEAMPGRFSLAATTHLANSWIKALELIAAHPPETPLASLDPLCDACLATLATHESGGTALACDFGGIWQAFAESAARHPGAPARLRHGKITTYQDLTKEAESLAASLAAHGVSRGDRVASRLDDRTHAATVVLACARLQAVYMPFDADVPADRLAAMIRIAEPRALVCDLDPDEAWSGIPHLDPRAVPPAPALPPVEPHDATLPFCLLFTSGSTGEPKGVLNHHLGILNEVLAIGEMLAIRPDDRVMQFASLGFDAALEEILATLMAGACLVPREESILESFELYQQFLTENRVTIADLPTAYWAGWCAWLASTGSTPPAGVRAVIIGGEKAGAGSTDAWNRACDSRIPVYNTYGPTETAIVATAAPLVIPADGSDPPIGRPLPGLKARIVDPTGRTAPPHRPGELWLGGAGVGLGYLNRPELTTAAFVFGDRPGLPDWYRTGDLASMDDDGTLHFHGRVDDQVKIRGKRIEPDEIRARLEAIDTVRQAHVGAPIIDGRRQLVAWLVSDAPEAEIRDELRRSLPGWMIPAAFVFLDALPLNARGKVDRRALPVPEVAPEEILADSNTSSDPLEKWMASLFAEVLGIDPAAVRLSADFAEQGGDSLSAMLLATRLAKAGVDLEPGELAVDSSPRLLATRIRDGYGKSRTSWEPILQLRAGDPSRPPLVLIHATPGDVLGYANLVTQLDPSQPCLGVVSRGLHLPDQAHASIEEMAASYIEALRPRLDGQPWLLGGWCYGGIVAYEMARQLVAAGQPEPLVILIEAWAQSPADPAAARKLTLTKVSGLLGMPLSAKLGYLRHRLAARKKSADPVPAAADDGFSRSVIYQTNLRAIARYQPAAYLGKLHLLLADDHGHDTIPVKNAGWHALGARCEVHAITGGHDLALRPPHVTRLAETITRLLAAHPG